MSVPLLFSSEWVIVAVVNAVMEHSFLALGSVVHCDGLQLSPSPRIILRLPQGSTLWGSLQEMTHWCDNPGHLDSIRYSFESHSSPSIYGILWSPHPWQVLILRLLLSKVPISKFPSNPMFVRINLRKCSESLFLLLYLICWKF